MKNCGKDEAKPQSNLSFFGEYGNTSKSEGSPKSPQQKSPKKIHRETPDWCLDSVTHEIMEYPVQLPSGHWVDNSTIVKWRKESKIWYAGLTDPFTGTKIDYELHVDTDKRDKILDYIGKWS